MLSRHTGVKSDEEEDVDVKVCYWQLCHLLNFISNILQPKVQSSVVSAQKSVSKSDLIKAQNVDEKGKARWKLLNMLAAEIEKIYSIFC